MRRHEISLSRPNGNKYIWINIPHVGKMCAYLRPRDNKKERAQKIYIFCSLFPSILSPNPFHLRSEIFAVSWHTFSGRRREISRVLFVHFFPAEIAARQSLIRAAVAPQTSRVNEQRKPGLCDGYRRGNCYPTIRRECAVRECTFTFNENSFSCGIRSDERNSKLFNNVRQFDWCDLPRHKKSPKRYGGKLNRRVIHVVRSSRNARGDETRRVVIFISFFILPILFSEMFHWQPYLYKICSSLLSGFGSVSVFSLSLDSLSAQVRKCTHEWAGKLHSDAFVYLIGGKWLRIRERTKPFRPKWDDKIFVKCSGETKSEPERERLRSFSGTRTEKRLLDWLATADRTRCRKSEMRAEWVSWSFRIRMQRGLRSAGDASEQITRWKITRCEMIYLLILPILRDSARAHAIRLHI